MNETWVFPTAERFGPLRRMTHCPLTESLVRYDGTSVHHRLVTAGSTLLTSARSGTWPSDQGRNGLTGWPSRKYSFITLMFSFSFAICRPMAVSSPAQEALSISKVLGGTW